MGSRAVLKGAWQKGQGANAPTGRAVLVVEPDVGTSGGSTEKPHSGVLWEDISAIEATFLWGGALAWLQPSEKALPSVFLLESWLILT